MARIPDVFYDAFNRMLGGGPASPVFNVGGRVRAILSTVDGQDISATTSGELLTSQTERENDVWSQYLGAFNATKYVILISKDNSAFPHKRQHQDGLRLDVTSMYYAADLAANTEAIIKVGVITRINGTNSDIEYAIGLPFLTGVTKNIIIDSLRGVPSQVKLDFNASGDLLHGVTNVRETDVVAVHTGLTLDSPIGNIQPGLGDVIMKYEHTGGSMNFGAFLFYHNTD